MLRVCVSHKPCLEGSCLITRFLTICSLNLITSRYEVMEQPLLNLSSRGGRLAKKTTATGLGNLQIVPTGNL